MYRSQSAAYLEDCMARGNVADDCGLIDKIIGDFKSTKLSWIFIVLICYTISNVFRALRWGQLLEPMGYDVAFKNTFMTTMIGYFTNLGLPRMGEIIKPTLLAKYENIEVEKVFGTIVVDRIADVICLLCVLVIALLTQYDSLYGIIEKNDLLAQKSSFLFDNPLIIIGVGLFALGILYFIVTNKKVQSTGVYQKIEKLVRGFWEGLISVKDVKRPFLFIFYSVGIWVMYFLMTYLCFFAYEPTAHLGPNEGFVTFLFGCIGMVFPSPGGLGSYHFFVTEALVLYDVVKADAFSFAMIIFFAIQLACNILMGLVSFILLPILNRKS